MVFVEMLEFLGRIAHAAFKQDEDMELYQKIDKVLDSVLSLVG